MGMTALPSGQCSRYLCAHDRTHFKCLNEFTFVGPRRLRVGAGVCLRWRQDYEQRGGVQAGLGEGVSHPLYEPCRTVLFING